MATNKKITDLTELSEVDLADDDMLAIVDVSAGTTNKVRKSTLASALAGVSSITATTPIAVDVSTGAVVVSTGTIPITKGGTGATSAAAALTALGAFAGPASATDNAAARFDGTTGKLIQNSTVTISDAGAVTATSLNGILGSGTPAAAAVTTLTTSGSIKSGAAGTNGHLELARTSDGATITNFKTDGTNGIINSVADTIIQVNTTEKVRVTSTGVAITGGITGDVVAAQSEMETATAVDAIVSPGRQHFHPSAAKFWCQASISGTAITSYNVTSVTDTAVGKVTVNIANDFSSADFCAVGGAVLNLGATAALLYAVSPPTAAGTILVQATNIANNAFVDPAEWSVVGFGDLT
jgi:flagellin